MMILTQPMQSRQSTPSRSQTPAASRTLIGWHGIRFTLPKDWNVTGFSMDRANGYLKVDSTGTMFVQVKWTDARSRKPASLNDLLCIAWRKARKQPAPEPKPPDLRTLLEAFLKQTGKRARKSKASFDCKVKPETLEAGGDRTAHHFAWSGGGHGQGKIWHCRRCGRVVIAQVVGQGKDNISAVASEMFSSLTDHASDGWNTWALYDLVVEAPADFHLKSQKLMSGYLRLELERRAEKIVIDRWGLASITRKRFTLAEWFAETCSLTKHRVTESATDIRGHAAVRATGRIRGLLTWLVALRAALFTLRPATRYDGCVWECTDSNKLFAIQTWHNVRTVGMLDEMIERCVCH